MSERGVDHIAEARQWLHWWSKNVAPPVTADTKKRLRSLAKALEDLDEAGWIALYRTLGTPVADLQAAVEAATRSPAAGRGRRGHDIEYRLAVKYLVKAWETQHRCSPLTRLGEFQEFAAAITSKYGAPVPGEAEIRRWVKGKHDPRKFWS